MVKCVSFCKQISLIRQTDPTAGWTEAALEIFTKTMPPDGYLSLMQPLIYGKTTSLLGVTALAETHCDIICANYLQQKVARALSCFEQWQLMFILAVSLTPPPIRIPWGCRLNKYFNAQ